MRSLDYGDKDILQKALNIIFSKLEITYFCYKI